MTLSTLASKYRRALQTSQAGADGRTVELVATAPDGTQLWRFYDGRWVYFASSGTSSTLSCDKNCRRTDDVPTTYGDR